MRVTAAAKELTEIDKKKDPRNSPRVKKSQLRLLSGRREQSIPGLFTLPTSTQGLTKSPSKSLIESRKALKQPKLKASPNTISKKSLLQVIQVRKMEI